MNVFLVVFILAVAIIAPFGKSAAEPEFSSWFKSLPPSLKTIDSQFPSGLLPAYNNSDCLPETKFVTIPKNFIKLQNETSHTACAGQSAFGQQSLITGDIKLNGTEVAGPVKDSNGSNRPVETIPGSPHVMFSGSGLYGLTRYIIRDFLKNSDVRVRPDSSIFHQLKPGVIGQTVKNSSGELPEFTDARFSENGKWMVGEVPFYGMTRVNIETGQMLKFGPPYNHANGVKPRFVSAVSGDGRYVIVGERDYEIIRLYDLSDCRPECKSVDLLQTIKTRIDGFKNIYHLQFSTNYSIRIYAQSVDTAGKSGYGYYLMTAAGEKESALEYLALGDSFASGEGAYSYKSGTDERQPFNKCHLSLVSYPYLLASKTNLNSIESIACSGAKMKDIYFARGEDEYSLSNKQSEGKEDKRHDAEIYSRYLPGYRGQLSFVEKNKPAAATLSLSGNDVGFGRIVLACVMPSNCYDTPQERLNLFHTINSQFSEIVTTLGQIKTKAGTGAKIYLISYPSLASPEGSCALNVLLDKQEIIFSNQLVAYLNSVLKNAALKAGVAYVDVENAFLGKRMCETISSDVAVNGLTAGDDKTFSVPLKFTNHDIDFYLVGRESYHPNQLGHRLLSEAIASSTNYLLNENPNPSLAVAGLTFEEAVDQSGAGGLGLSPRKIVYQDNLTDSLAFTGHRIELRKDNLLPMGTADVSLGTISLGSSPVGSDGILNTNFKIPAGTKPAAYTIHILVKNKAGEDIDIQKEVYAAASETDIDGDAILNNQEKCLFVNSSGVDQDKDNVDDACDGHISYPPPFILLATPTSAWLPQLKVTPVAQPEFSSLKTATLPRNYEPLYVLGSSTKPPKLNEDLTQTVTPAKRKILVIFLPAIALAILVWLFRKKWRKTE